MKTMDRDSAALLSIVGTWVLLMTLVWSTASAQPVSIDRANVQVVVSNAAVLDYPVTCQFDSFGTLSDHIRMRSTCLSRNWPAFDIGGAMQSATLWVFLYRNGQWLATGAERLRPNQVNDNKPQPPPNEVIRSFWQGRNFGPLNENGREPKPGEVIGEQPAPGELVGVMLAAGQSRLGHDVTVRERSDIILVRWPDARGAAELPLVWREGATTPPPVVTPPPVTPPPPTTPDPLLTALAERVAALEMVVADLKSEQGVQRDAFATFIQMFDALHEEVKALMAKPIKTECRAALWGIPISCRLE